MADKQSIDRSGLSLRKILIVSLAALILLPMIPLALSTWNIYRVEVKRVEGLLQETNQQLGNLAIRSLLSFLQTYADTLADPDNNEVETLSTKWLTVDQHGRVLYSQLASLPAGSEFPSGVDWHRISGTGSVPFDVSDNVNLQKPEGLRIFVRIAMEDTDTFRIGIIDPNFLRHYLTGQFETFVNRHIYAVDERGNPLFYANLENPELAPTLRANDPVQLFLKGGEGPVRYVSSISGKERVGFVHRIKPVGWGLIVSADIGTRLLDIRQREAWLLAALCTGGLIAAVIFFFFTRRILQPLVLLAQQLKGARTEGPIQLTLPEKDQQLLEFDLLVTAFNSYAKKLMAAENDAIQAEKAATLGELTAGLAHEIGTPLNVMRGNAQYLMKKYDSDHPDRIILEKIVDQTGRIAGLIRNLLDVARSDTGGPIRFDLHQIIHRALETATTLHPNVSIELDLDKNLPRLCGYPRRLEHALLNILLNGCQAMKGQGSLKIHTWKERFNGRDQVRIIIKDSGCGIPQENLDKIFAPFFSTKGSGQGAGLGLALVDRVLREHKGSIEVESKVDLGSRFILTLPTDGSENGSLP